MNVEAEEKDKNFRAVGLLSNNELEEPQHNKQQVTWQWYLINLRDKFVVTCKRPTNTQRIS